MTSKRTLKPRKTTNEEHRRLLMFGSDQLADIQLLALVMGGHRPIARALALLDDTGGLLGLDRADPQQMRPIAGPNGAAALAAALELGRRVVRLRVPYARSIDGPDDVAAFLRASIGAAAQETFLVLGLNVRRRLQMVRTIAVGSLCSVRVHPREIFRPLVHAGVWGALLVHNHPSGDPDPSDADVIMARRMAEVGRVLGIAVIDALVVARGRTASLRELGLLEAPTED